MSSIPCFLPFPLTTTARQTPLPTVAAASPSSFDLLAIPAFLKDLAAAYETTQGYLGQLSALMQRHDDLLAGMVQAPTPYSSRATGARVENLRPRTGGAEDAGGRALLEVYCLGPFRVQASEGAPLTTWRNRKARDLMKFFIAQQGKPLSRDVLIETFWPQFPLEAAHNSLRVALHDLRRALSSFPVGGEVGKHIEVHGGNYTLLDDAPVWVDAEAFQAHWRKGRALERMGSLQQAMAHYQQAVSLYRGDFLEEDLYEDWALAKRETLLDVYLAVLDKLSEYYFGRHEYDDCAELLHALLGRDHCRETAYRRLMMCHSRQGQRSRAVHWYEVCRRALREGLGAAPSPETEALYQRLLRAETL